MKEKLFSVNRHDCRWDTFRSGGPGGQNQNKVETGVRCTHEKSGAVGESRERNSQWGNKQLAFQRMAKTSAFQAWVKREAARVMGQPHMTWSDGYSVQEVLATLEDERNCRVEVRDEIGRWVELV